MNGTGNEPVKNGNVKNFNISSLNTLLNSVSNLVKPEIKSSGTIVTEVVKKLENVIQTTSNKLDTSEQTSKQLDQELSVTKLEITNLQEEIEQLRKTHKQEINILKASSNSNKNAKIAELSTIHNQALLNKNTASKEIQNKLEQQRNNISRELESKSNELISLQSQYRNLEEQKNAVESEIEKYKSSLSRAGVAIQSLKQKITNYNRSYKELETQISTIYGKYSHNGELLTNSNEIIKRVKGESVVTEPVPETEEPLEGGSKKRITRKSKSTKPKSKQTKSKSKKSTKTKKVSKKRV